MGNTSSAHGGERLAEHRDSLYRRQCAVHKRIERLRDEAREQLRLGNRDGALNSARQLKLAEQQARSIGGFITRIDSQRHAIETKELTAQTMNIMAHTQKVLGRGLTENTLGQAEDLAVTCDDTNDELREIAQALGTTLGGGETEEELLSAIGGGEEVHEARGEPPRARDDVFLDWARSQMLPDAPVTVPKEAVPPARGAIIF